MRHHIQHLKEKPEHVRRRIAVGTSAGVTVIVALVWMVTLSSSGVLALKNAPTSESENVAESARSAKEGITSLLGAVGAAPGESTSPALSIIDNGASSTLDQKQNQPSSNATVIPF
jgi:hypothetical protein